MKAETQKTDGTILETNKIIVSIFSVLNKDDRMKFFQENFPLAKVKLDVILGIVFLTINNTNINFKTWTYNKGLIILKRYF